MGRLPKALKIFGVAHGGFRCVPKIPVDDRARLIDKLRSTGKGGSLVAEAQLSPLSVVGAVATSGHLGESPLRELITGSASTLADLQVPPPKRSHADASLDGEALADDRSALARGRAWRAEVARRADPSDAGDDNDAVVMWAARVMDRIVIEQGSDGSVADVDDAFGLAMAEGLSRGSRVLSAFCARYAPRTPDQAATAAGGFRSVASRQRVQHSMQRPTILSCRLHKPRQPVGSLGSWRGVPLENASVHELHQRLQDDDLPLRQVFERRVSQERVHEHHLAVDVPVADPNVRLAIIFPTTKRGERRRHAHVLAARHDRSCADRGAADPLRGGDVVRSLATTSPT